MNFGLFQIEITQISNGWLLTTKSIPILGMVFPETRYFPTLQALMKYLDKKEKQAKKRAEKNKTKKRVSKR